jgi:peptide/nickel transport system permease protein
MTLLEQAVASAVPEAPVDPGRTRVRTRRVSAASLLSSGFLGVLLVAVIRPSLLTGANPLAINQAATLLPPSLHHLFGTDESGRDVFTRVVYGARESLSIGVAATAIGLALGILLGLAAGLGGRWGDTVVSRFLEVLFAFPSMLLALLFVAMFGAGVSSLIIAVGIGTAPGYARMIRGQVLAVKGMPYVEAAQVLGHSRSRIVVRNILPNAMRPLVVLGTLGVGQSIVWASALSFLGLGAAPPAPEWGAMLAAGRDYISVAWWLELMPGAVIVLTSLATTALGRHVQRHIEGRLPA